MPYRHYNHHLQLIIATGTLFLMALSLGVVAFVQIPSSQINLFTALASGVAGGAFGVVVGFLFGASLEHEPKIDEHK